MVRKRKLFILSIIVILMLGEAFSVQAVKYNATVEQAQRKLKDQGYSPGQIDGLWGKKTEAALKQFQQDHGVPVTGKLNEETKRKLGFQASFTPKSLSSVRRITLRSTPAELTKEDIVKMIRDKGFHHPADYSNLDLSPRVTGNFVHSYELHTLQGEKVVVDHATGLMWQQTPADFVPGGHVETHLKKVNQEHYAGFSDWRLPTIEELASLLEHPEKKTDFIDPVFAVPFWFCLSTDKVKGKSAPWVVFFEDGYIMDHSMNDDFYILLVRSI